MNPFQTFLERLDQGPVIGDGGFVFALEKRGVVKAGPWTPEAVIEHPEAVRQLHTEFVRAGSDVCQAYTYYGSEDKLSNRGNHAGQYGLSNRGNHAGQYGVSYLIGETTLANTG
eukprot:sb/3476834/